MKNDKKKGIIKPVAYFLFTEEAIAGSDVTMNDILLVDVCQARCCTEAHVEFALGAPLGPLQIVLQGAIGCKFHDDH